MSRSRICGGPPGSRAPHTDPVSIRDALPDDVTEPFLRAIDRLLKALARHEVEAR